jgi:hypothetical protein
VAEGGNWIGEQTTVEMMGAVDSGHHHVSHERVSQSVLWPPPFIQVPSQFIHAGQNVCVICNVTSSNFTASGRTGSSVQFVSRGL